MVASMVLVLRIDNRLPVHLKPVVPVMVWAVLATVNELRLPKLPVPELVVQAASSNGLAQSVAKPSRQADVEWRLMAYLRSGPSRSAGRPG
ncbi:Uncharacterised protein [Klebsiella pneumoniae]|nr:Uncharacterised protein [Klebsiella pneumoniae]